MKSRTYFFNLTAFRKALTRFAPIWALYTVCLLLILFGISGQKPVYMARDIRDIMQITAWGNLIYAGVVAMLLFGDLYKTRLCYALHAFPLRREGWLLTNVVSGLLFSLVPNTLVCILASFALGEYAYLVWLWLAVAMLQYLFFFGTAVLSAVCAGNRLGMAAIYCMIQFVMVLVYGLAELIYQPLIYGIELRTDNFYRFFPLRRMLGVEYIDTLYTAKMSKLEYRGIVPENWIHLAICTAVGLLCVVLALLVYRRRHLERAGDFVALKALAPVFLVVYAVAVSAVFYIFSQMIGNPSYLLLALGLVVGYFTGQMLLRRTLRVFYKKSLLGFAILAVVIAGSMGLTWLDPLGIGRWVPDLEQVESAAIYGSDKNYVYAESYKYNRFEITDREELTQLQEFHSLLANTRPGYNDGRLYDVRIRYTLKDGTVVNRYYQVIPEGPLGEQANRWYSDARYIFQLNNPEELYDLFCAFNVDRYAYIAKYSEYTPQDYADDTGYLKSEDQEAVRGLLDAILADCKAGNMNQSWLFHEDDKEMYGIGFELSLTAEIQTEGESSYRFRTLQIWDDSTYTVAYLEKLFAQQENVNEQVPMK